MSDSELGAFQTICESKIEQLSNMIVDRDIVERTSKDEDFLLQGFMLLLTTLLQKFVHCKKRTGSALIKYLVHDCLFEIPHGTKGDSKHRAPKCKKYETRQAALNLVSVLSRDCLENLVVVLNYLKGLQGQATWRTKKETDWDVKLYNDEKSLTGRVGIKNLGCICYMNSLNQQLFMIPTFRNDVLSIEDPNHDN